MRRVISDSQVKAKSAFKLKDASVGGKAVLVPEPARWQQLEEAHVIGRVIGRVIERVPPRKAKRPA